MEFPVISRASGQARRHCCIWPKGGAGE